MSTPAQNTRYLSIKSSLYYHHKEDDTNYYAAYTGKATSGDASKPIYNQNVKCYSMLYKDEPIDFRHLEIVDVWCKDLSERDWRRLNPEVIEAMCCLLNPSPGQYKIHFFNKKGNTNAQAFTYSTMIFRIVLHCETDVGIWHGTLPIRINTRSSALKHVWTKYDKKKGAIIQPGASNDASTRPKKRARISAPEEAAVGNHQNAAMNMDDAHNIPMIPEDSLDDAMMDENSSSRKRPREE